MPSSVRSKSGSLTHFQEHQPLIRGKKIGQKREFSTACCELVLVVPCRNSRIPTKLGLTSDDVHYTAQKQGTTHPFSECELPESKGNTDNPVKSISEDPEKLADPAKGPKRPMPRRNDRLGKN